MKRGAWMLVACLVCLAALAQAQSQAQYRPLSAAGASSIVRLSIAVHKRTVAVVASGALATCLVRLEGSLDGMNCFDLSGRRIAASR